MWAPLSWELASLGLAGVGEQQWGYALKGDRAQGLVTCEGLVTLDWERLSRPGTEVHLGAPLSLGTVRVGV